MSAAPSSGQEKNTGEKVTLRIANWEEYIDEGDWDEEEAIDLEDRESTVIFGENSMIEDFEGIVHPADGGRDDRLSGEMSQKMMVE